MAEQGGLGTLATPMIIEVGAEPPCSKCFWIFVFVFEFLKNFPFLSQPSNYLVLPPLSMDLRTMLEELNCALCGGGLAWWCYVCTWRKLLCDGISAPQWCRSVRWWPVNFYIRSTKCWGGVGGTDRGTSVWSGGGGLSPRRPESHGWRSHSGLSHLFTAGNEVSRLLKRSRLSLIKTFAKWTIASYMSRW